MKKIYMQPLTEVVKINVEQMICQSLEVKELIIDGEKASEFIPADKEDFTFLGEDIPILNESLW